MIPKSSSEMDWHFNHGQIYFFFPSKQNNKPWGGSWRHHALRSPTDSRSPAKIAKEGGDQLCDVKVDCLGWIHNTWYSTVCFILVRRFSVLLPCAYYEYNIYSCMGVLLDWTIEWRLVSQQCWIVDGSNEGKRQQKHLNKPSSIADWRCDHSISLMHWDNAGRITSASSKDRTTDPNGLSEGILTRSNLGGSCAKDGVFSGFSKGYGVNPNRLINLSTIR